MLSEYKGATQSDSKPIHKFLTNRTHPTEPSQHQINLIRTSWERVCQIQHQDHPTVSPSHAFGIAFYEALFEAQIECKHFLSNIIQQSRAFTGMVSFLTRSPHVTQPESPTTIRDINARMRGSCPYVESDPEAWVVEMKHLGAKHCLYQVPPHYFDLVGPAFVVALKKRLREEYTDEIGEAWLKANSYAAYNMKIGYETQHTWEDDLLNDRSNSKKLNQSCTIQ